MAGRVALRRTGLALALMASPGCSGGEEAPAAAPPAPAAVPAAAPAPIPVPAPAPAPTPTPAPRRGVDERAPWEKEKDPVKARTLKLEEEWRLDPQFTDMKLRFFDEGPALGAIEAGEGGPDLPADGDSGKELTHALAEFIPRFQALLREAGLEPPSLADLGDARIRLMLFRTRESFDAWHARMNFQNPGGPYHRPVDQTILGWAGDLNRKGVRYLATLVLFRLYGRHFCQVDDDANARRSAESPEKVYWDDHRLPCAFLWFEHGLARYFASPQAESATSVHWESPGPDPNDMEVFHSKRTAREFWNLEDFLFCDAHQVCVRAKTMAGGEGADQRIFMVAVQGTFLIRYFLDGDGGRWRPAFLAMVRNEVRGRSGYPYLLEAFGLVDDRGRPVRVADPKVAAFIKEVEPAYLAYADSLK